MGLLDDKTILDKLTDVLACEERLVLVKTVSNQDRLRNDGIKKMQGK